MIWKKIIARLLALTLMFSLTATASAGSRSWVSGEFEYTAILTAGSFGSEYSRTSFGKYHAKGTTTTITATAGGSYSKDAQNKLALNCSNIGTLMRNDGYSDRVSYYVASGTAITVPTNAVTGNYYMVVNFAGAAINITVRQYQVDSDGNRYLVDTDILHSDYTPKIYGCTLGYIKG